MKKFSSLLFSSLLFFSCENALVVNSEQNNGIVENIEKRVVEIRQSGLLDNLFTENTGALRSASNGISDSLAKDMNDFIESPSAFLTTHNAQEDMNGLLLVDAIYSGATVGEVYERMNAISTEAADEYLETVETSIASFNSSTGRAVMSQPELLQLKLRFFEEKASTDMNRGIFEANFNDDTVYWYYGMCASTIAGLTMYRIGTINPFVSWLVIPGGIAAAAGSISMVTQLVIWATSTVFSNYISALSGPNCAAVNNIIANSGIGEKLLGISVATIGVGAFCCLVTPEIKEMIVGPIRIAWNSVVGVVNTILPGVTVLINDIPIILFPL